MDDQVNQKLFFLNFASWVILHAFFVSINSLDPDHVRRFVRPDLSSKFLQRISADDTVHCVGFVELQLF